MDLNVEHYVYKAKFINDKTCDDVRNILDDESNWRAFPKDEINAKEDDKRKTDGLAGSTLSYDWHDLFNNITCEDFLAVDDAWNFDHF